MRTGLKAKILLIMLCAASLAAGATACEWGSSRIDLSRYVAIYPGSPIVELPGDATTLEVKVRNVFTSKLTGLRLEVKSDACSKIEIRPAAISEIIPGDRESFSVTLTRDRSRPRQRYPLLVTLRASSGLPVAAGLDLMVDLSLPTSGKWIDVGQVTLVAKEESRTVYYLLAGAPLLFVVAWLLWRLSRPGRRPPAKSS